MESKGPMERRRDDPADPSSHSLYPAPTPVSDSSRPATTGATPEPATPIPAGETTPMDTGAPEPGYFMHTMYMYYVHMIVRFWSADSLYLASSCWYTDVVGIMWYGQVRHSSGSDVDFFAKVSCACVFTSINNLSQ